MIIIVYITITPRKVNLIRFVKFLVMLLIIYYKSSDTVIKSIGTRNMYTFGENKLNNSHKIVFDNRIKRKYSNMYI